MKYYDQVKQIAKIWDEVLVLFTAFAAHYLRSGKAPVKLFTFFLSP